MVEMYLIKIDYEDDEEVLSFRTPGLADIALDVCTPVQIRAIATALLERLEPIKPTNFRVPLLMADLHDELGQKEECKKQCWKMSYSAFLNESKNWSCREKNQWKELMQDELEAAGYDAAAILGDDFSVRCKYFHSVGTMLPLLKIYSAPVSLGPFGHTLSVICRNTFHELGAFHGASREKVNTLRAATKSAADRYLKEMVVIETFLTDKGIPALEEELQRERDLLAFITAPATDGDEVQTKAAKILNEFVPQVVEPRLQRLYTLIDKLRYEEVPSFIQKGPQALREAYGHLRIPTCTSKTCRMDAAQNALMYVV